MSVVAAGWYPDPNDAAQVRWWDGTAWTSATQPNPRLMPQAQQFGTPVTSVVTPVVTPEPAQRFSVPGMGPVQSVPQYGPGTGYSTGATFQDRYAANQEFAKRHSVRGQMDREVRARNPFAWTALLLVIIALFVNLFGLVSVVAVVFGIVGIVRAARLSAEGATTTGFAGALIAVLVGAGQTIWFAVHFVSAMHGIGY